jgi:hypothetical protein
MNRARLDLRSRYLDGLSKFAKEVQELVQDLKEKVSDTDRRDAARAWAAQCTIRESQSKSPNPSVRCATMQPALGDLGAAGNHSSHGCIVPADWCNPQETVCGCRTIRYRSGLPMHHIPRVVHGSGCRPDRAPPAPLAVGAGWTS